MKGIIIKFEDLSHSREIIEQKTPRFMLYFLYFLIIVFISLLTWSYLAKKEIVVKSRGVVIAENKQSIVPLVSGKVDQIYFTEGDIVKEGDLILEIEHKGLEEKRDYYISEIESYQEKVVLSLKLEQSINELTNLFDKDKIEEMEMYYDVQSFLLQYNLEETAEAKEEFKSKKLIEVYNQIKGNQSYLNQYEIELLNSEKEIETYKLYSEIEGIVHYVKDVSVGETVQAGYEVLKINSDNDNNKLQILVSNQDIAKIQVGQTIRVDVPALSNREYGFGKAEVTSIETDARFDQQSGQSFYIVEAQLLTQSLKSDVEEKDLKVGMVVNSRMITSEQRYLHWFIEKLGLWMFD